MLEDPNLFIIRLQLGIIIVLVVIIIQLIREEKAYVKETEERLVDG